MIIIVMGVSGSGKTTVGQGLATALDCNFYDGDDFHPEANVHKMRNKIPLTDEDRFPWLGRIRSLMESHLEEGKSMIIACSALRHIYREKLSLGLENVTYVYLKGDYSLIEQRMKNREGHYMPAALLKSQFDTLEEPHGENIISVDIQYSKEEILKKIKARLM